MLSIVDQIKTASQRKNRLATFGGFILGGFVPAATFFTVHYHGEINPAVLYIIVAGGLLFSAKTVFEWGRTAFNNGIKAVGFCLLIEGVMTFGDIFVLSCIAMGLLVVINGVATGCNLVMQQKDMKPVKAKTQKPAKKTTVRMHKVA